MTSPPAWVVERNIFNLLAEADRKLDLLELEIYYRERHNYEIPFQHYGYDSLDAFLRTLKDTCEVR